MEWTQIQFEFKGFFKTNKQKQNKKNKPHTQKKQTKLKQNQTIINKQTNKQNNQNKTVDTWISCTVDSVFDLGVWGWKGTFPK